MAPCLPTSGAAQPPPAGERIGLALDSRFLEAVIYRSFDFTAHMCTGIIHKNYKLFVNPLFKTNCMRAEVKARGDTGAERID